METQDLRNLINTLIKSVNGISGIYNDKNAVKLMIASTTFANLALSDQTAENARTAISNAQAFIEIYYA